MPRSLLVLAPIAIVIALVIWLQEPITRPPTASLVIPNNIDYYLKNSRQISFKKDGSIDFTLNSAFLKHFKHEDKSELSQPKMQMQRKNTWLIQADNGNYLHPTEIMTFNANVVLNKKSDTGAFNVFAHKLLFNIQQNLVISDSGVKVEADDWYINAHSMTLDMDKEIHQFNTVKARYRNDKKS